MILCYLGDWDFIKQWHGFHVKNRNGKRSAYERWVDSIGSDICKDCTLELLKNFKRPNGREALYMKDDLDELNEAVMWIVPKWLKNKVHDPF